MTQREVAGGSVSFSPFLTGEKGGCVEPFASALHRAPPAVAWSPDPLRLRVTIPTGFSCCLGSRGKFIQREAYAVSDNVGGATGRLGGLCLGCGKHV